MADEPVAVAPIPGETPAQPKKRRKLLIWGGVGCVVVLIAGCLAAAIVLPGLQSAPKRARQKRAMSEVRSIATAVQAFDVDNKRVPLAAGTEKGPWKFVSIGQLAPDISPFYMQNLPEKDPWGQPYLYGVTGEAEVFCVLSTGSDGKRDSEILPDQVAETQCQETDIIWLNEAFLQSPAGPQRACGEGGK